MNPFSQSSPATSPRSLDVVREKAERLRCGVVQLIVHEGRVTLIECTEKTRLMGGRDAPPAG